jgi:hypothetical protein
VASAVGLDTTKFLDDARDRLAYLQQRHASEVGDLELLNAHYEGSQPLSYMAPELLVELGDRMRQVVVHWPELVVDSVEERLDGEGFRLGGQAEVDDELLYLWQANGLDLASHQAHVDALVMRRSYVIIGSRSEYDRDPSSGVEDDIPVVTVESPLEVYASRIPRTGIVRDAAKWWSDDVSGESERRRVTLYLPDSTAWLRWTPRQGGGHEWTLDEDDSPGIDDHKLGVVPVVPIVNRPRTKRMPKCGGGKSDLDAVIPLSDAACKIATDMMTGAEFHALPRRAVFGAKASDFVDEHGRQTSPFSRIVGRIWAFEDSETKAMQFPEANLSGFHDTMKLLAQLAASISGLPPHYVGMSTDNPASADAIRSSEARLVKRAERRQRAFGEAWERAMRIALLVRHGEVSPEAARMEMQWRDASTPTIAQRADATVKLFQAGLLPRLQAWEDLGYSSTQIARMQKEIDKEAERAAEAFGVGRDPQMPGDSQQPMGEADGTAAGRDPAPVLVEAD